MLTPSSRRIQRVSTRSKTSMQTLVVVFTSLTATYLPTHSWSFIPKFNSRTSPSHGVSLLAADGTARIPDTTVEIEGSTSYDVFADFVDFLRSTQNDIIQQIEEMDGLGNKFSNDTWGVFDESSTDQVLSGGITRVLQGGNVVEKGACSLTLIRRGILSAERAATIRARQDIDIQPGDAYYAAALSIVLHSRSPMVPTFRSDVRIFLVKSDSAEMAWFGGGADLTPYYLFDEDVKQFHRLYRDLCKNNPKAFSYSALKQSCDDYFYLPARAEHRGTGGIFFDDMPATEPYAMPFVKSVAQAWMPSWLPIVETRRDQPFTEQQKQWQLLRRGRYLEFNLLYDRGVKFGLANTNPRVEGVMVSAPPLIAWEYNHKIEEGSEEERLMKILKTPKDWI